MNKRIKKKKTKRAMTANRIIAAENRLKSKRLVQGKKAVMSADALLKKSLKTLSEQIKIKSLREQRRKFIEEQITALENKDRSRRRGPNKNKWTEVDLQKYAKLKQEQALLHPHSGRKFKYNEIDSNTSEVGALVAKYHDYVNRGIIQPKSYLNNYEQASYMRNEVLTKQEMQSVLDQADKWRTAAAERRAARKAEDVGFIDF